MNTKRLLCVSLLSISLLTACGKGKDIAKDNSKDNNKANVETVMNKDDNLPKLYTQKVIMKGGDSPYTEEEINAQVRVRVAQRLAKKYNIEYTIDDVIKYFSEEVKKSENQLKSKLDVATTMESQMVLINARNYAIAHQLDYLKAKIHDMTLEDRIAEIPESQKEDIYGQYSALYQSLGVDEEKANKRALIQYADTIFWDSIDGEISDYTYDANVEIFREYLPELYEQLPSKAEADDYNSQTPVENK